MSTNTPAISKTAWLPIEYTREFLRFLEAKGFKCSTIFDIGAFKGDWAREFLEVFPDAHVVMFEPLEEMKETLNKFCRALPDTQWFQVALGSKTGTADFIVKPSPSGSYCIPGTPKSVNKSYQHRRVETWTVNDLIKAKNLDIPQLVKMDVQGFELEVLKGANMLFAKTEVFILEVSLYRFLGPHHPLFSEIISFMEQEGYMLYDIISFHRRSVDHALGQCDACFVKNDSPLRNRVPLVKPFEWDWFRRYEKNPVNIIWGDGYYNLRENKGESWRWSNKQGTFYLVNRSDSRKNVDIKTFIITASSRESVAEIRVNGELTDHLKINKSIQYEKSIVVSERSEVEVKISMKTEKVEVGGEVHYFCLHNFEYAFTL